MNKDSSNSTADKLDDCKACSFKANLVQYCIDNQIGPFSKYSTWSLDHAREVRLTVYLSLLQVILVTIFLFVSLSVITTPFPVGFNVLLYIIFSVVILYFILHYVFLHYSGLKLKDVDHEFKVANICHDATHESIIMNDIESIAHMSRGHNCFPIKLRISTTSFFRESLEIPFYIAMLSVVLATVNLIIHNKFLAVLSPIVFLVWLVSAVLSRYIPRRKNDVDLIEVYLACVPNTIVLVSFSLYTVSSLTMKKTTQNTDLNKLCYIPEPGYEKKRIYLIDSISTSLFRGVRKIDFIDDNEQVGVSDVKRLVTPRSLSKWNDLFSDLPANNVKK